MSLKIVAMNMLLGLCPRRVTEVVIGYAYEDHIWI